MTQNSMPVVKFQAVVGTLLLQFPNQFDLGEDTTAVSAEKQIQRPLASALLSVFH